MDTMTREAGTQLGVSARHVRRLAASGVIAGRELAGRRLVSSRSVLAASRSRGRGRRWTVETVLAALELLTPGTTDRVEGSALSRLRARLRAIEVEELAYQVLADRVTLWRTSRRDMTPGVGLTGTGSAITARVTSNANRLARHERLIQDLDGQLVLLELDTETPAAAEAIVRFAYGDARTSSAARSEITAMIDRLR